MAAEEGAGRRRLSRDELVGAVDKLLRGDTGSEEESDALLDQVLRTVPDAGRISDLIYHPTENLSAAEIVERALAYKPIAL